jgi:hypothetical protein
VALVEQPSLDRPGGKGRPPTVMSEPSVLFISLTASGSKSRSIRVLALDASSSVLEYTTLSAARHISAKS